MANKVLIVDDDSEMRQMIRVFLSLYSGIDELLMTESSRKALDFFNGRRKDISLVFIDTDIPELDGQDLIKRLKEMHYEGKIVQISGRGQNVKVEGSDYFLDKPFLATDLDSIMSKMGYNPAPRKNKI